MSRNPRSFYEEIARQVETLPDHDGDALEAAAHHLEMLHYQNLIDFTKKDFIRLTKKEFLAELGRVLEFSPRELGVTATVVEEWSAGAAGAEENRMKRMEFMFKEYQKLCRLRSNEPEAWDEINELYYDD